MGIKEHEEVFNSESMCPYTYGVVEELVGKNITQADALEWPCELREFWVDLRPLVNIVKFLLSYGTSAIVVCGVILNALSFTVLARKRMRKQTSNLYLSLLAVYDTCELLFNFMIGVIRGNSEAFNKVFQNSEGLCTFHAVIVELFNLLSVWIIVAFSIERFVMIKFPLKACSWSRRKTVITLFIVSVIVTLISFHKIAVTGFEGDSVFGYKPCKTRRVVFKDIMYIYVALNTWLPTCTIVALNGIIILVLRKNRLQRQQMTQVSVTKSDERATRLLLIVSSTFVILVLPLGIVQSVELVWNNSKVVPPGDPNYVDFMKTKLKLKWTRSLFFFLFQLNFMINFFFYVTSATRFKTTLKHVFGIKQKLVPAKAIRRTNTDDRQSFGSAASSLGSGTSTEESDEINTDNKNKDKNVCEIDYIELSDSIT